MGTDVNTTFRASIRAILADTGTDFTDAIVDEAISQAVADISRLAPREQLHVDVLHTRSIAAESFTSDHGVAVSLGFKPIDPRTPPTVTNSGATITYDEDTDFIMNYADGSITVLAAGSMADSTSHLITYEKSLMGIDISSLTALIIVERVEISRNSPRSYQEYTSWYHWGDILWLGDPDGDTQSILAENDHVRVWYQAEHTKPGASARSVPAYLDDMIKLGGVAYALFGKHRELNLTAATHAANGATAAALVEDNIAAAKTALDLVTALAQTMTTKLELAEGTAGDPLVLALTALTKVTTHAGEAGTALTLVASEVLTNSTGTSGKSADDYLDSGDGFIESIQPADNVPENYGLYAQTKVNIARAFIDEAIGRMQMALGFAREGEAQIAVANFYVAEALAIGRQCQAVIDQANGYIATASGYSLQVQSFVLVVDRFGQIADRFLIDARERYLDFQGHLQSRVERGQKRNVVANRQHPRVNPT